MNSLIAYFIAFSTLFGCITLPLAVGQAAFYRAGFLENDLTFRKRIQFIKSRESGPAFRKAFVSEIASATLAQLTFISIGTLLGTAVSTIWWLHTSSYSHSNPITYAVAGAGIGGLVSINLTIPVLGTRALKVSMPTKIKEPGRRSDFWQWILHGPELRRMRWSVLASLYLVSLCFYESIVFLFSLNSYYGQQKNSQTLMLQVWLMFGASALIIMLLGIMASKIVKATLAEAAKRNIWPRTD